MSKYNTLFNKRILVTGGSSMIGTSVVNQLNRLHTYVMAPPRTELDLLDYESVIRYVEKEEPDIIIHLGGYNGGIEWNRKYPATIFYRTATMALNVLTAAGGNGVEKVVSAISSCAYPENLEDMRELDFWKGKPNNTVECHGSSKRILEVYGRMINKQFPSTRPVSLIINNCYGPNDTFHLEKTKVVAAVIRKIYRAKESNDVPEFWGTGAAKREFVYCEDAARAIIELTKKYDDVNLPLNVSSGVEISIKELVKTVCELADYPFENVKWLHEKGDGQLSKKLNIDEMKKYLDFDFTPLEKGLLKTILWYNRNREYANNKL